MGKHTCTDPNTYEIKRRKSCAKGLGCIGTLFLLLAIALPFVIGFGAPLFIMLLYQNNSTEMFMLALVIEAIPVILALLFWAISARKQKGTLTILFRKLQFRFGRKVIEIDYDNLYSPALPYKGKEVTIDYKIVKTKKTLYAGSLYEDYQNKSLKFFANRL